MKKISIVVGSFHKSEAEIMVQSASSEIEEVGFSVGNIVWVPGAYESPLALKREVEKNDVEAVVVLGIIERGETAHGLVMAQSVSDAILRISLEFSKPVGMGILGPEIFPSQIPSRVSGYAKAAAKAVISMI